MREAQGRRLAREGGILAARLLAFLDRIFGSDGMVGAHRSALAELHGALADRIPLSEVSGCAIDRAPAGPPHPLDRLASAFALSPFEVDLLMLAGGPEQHEAFSSLLRVIHPRGEPRPTLALAAQLFCGSETERRFVREIVEDGSLFRAGIVRLSSDAPFFERSIVPAEGLWSALHGIDVWPFGIGRFTMSADVTGLEAWLEGQECRRARLALEQRQPCTILVTAESEDIAWHRAAALGADANVELACVRSEGPWTRDQERALAVHSALRGEVPVVRVPAADGSAPQLPSPGFVDQPGPLILCARRGAGMQRTARPIIRVQVDRLSPSARRAMWTAIIPGLANQAPSLAARYALEPYAAREIAADLRTIELVESRKADVEDVAACVRTRSSFAVSPVVSLVHPTASWAQLVLTPDRLAQLREAVDRLMQQTRVLDEWGFLAGRPGARGVRMLFAGPPGTGKTLSAEVLARELGVDLLIVDLSRVVSKWIGETEKNLAEVFDAAERAQAVLLFDEADALFGKRTEVSDAHDRYANLETAYLLSRMERFEGLAVLSTNLRKNIDSAFVRRLEFVVDFEEPSIEERKALWRCHLPRTAPLASDVDIAELSALYPIVGGLIRNAATAAGFLAAADSRRIDQNHLIRAIRREYQKSGRAFPGVPAGARFGEERS